jgi:hypothetical protein
VFESRDPRKEAWLEWNRERTWRRVMVPWAGPVETWTDLVNAGDGLVSFQATFVFGSDGGVLTSRSALRFRSRGELADSLAAAGLMVDEVRDAPAGRAASSSSSPGGRRVANTGSSVRG